MFLITGAGRSGTVYIARVLQRCGLDVGHERPGRDGIVSGFYAVDAPWYPGRHPTPRPQFDVVLHPSEEYVFVVTNTSGVVADIGVWLFWYEEARG